MNAPAVNWTGLRTLLRKEIHRFTKVWMQTVLAPLATTSLYFLVFGVALGERLATIDGVPYIEFVVPGLVMLAMINASFLNTASSLFQSKINGTTVDFLVAPLGPLELMVAYVAAAVLRAAIVGLMVWGVAVAFIGFEIRDVAFTVGFGLAVSAAFSILGLVVAIWAEKFDHLALVPNFVLLPLTFLGGVFYSIDMLPEPWNTISRFNPVLYMVNGLRDAMLGVSDVPPGYSVAAVGALLVALWITAWRILATGWNLRS